MNFSDRKIKTLALSAALLFAASGLRAETLIKFSTLAPDGSTWMKLMRQFGTELSSATQGRVKFKFYAGGVSGDEKDVARKIRLGQLNGAGFTGFGLGEIAPEIRVLDTPFLFKAPEEIDHIYKTFDADFKKIFEAKGYVLLGWAEVGKVYMFANSPITKPEDLKPVKMWLWEGDPVAEATLSAFRVNPIPLSVTDVMTSLQTGMINGVYSSPLSLLAMQWQTRMKYAFSLPITNACGAAVVSKKIFDKLSKEDQKTLTDLGDRHMRLLNAASRKDNEKAITTLKKEKITFTDPASPEVSAAFEKMGETARRALTGKLYSKELLEKIEAALRQFRAAKNKKN
ncbi:MAG: ABC transporter substrate-binding protein [Elusimicrobia bacterium RIFOXYB2_FULL_62_6]|nr:MAG: ABC transporter substrate-binding protein [Elusimicrobia bacterium RIFOXYB2_FULL_62_6]